MQPQLLDTKQAAALIGMSVAFLERDRWAGAHIPYIKIGARAVRYRFSDLMEYINSRQCLSNSR